MHDTDPVPTTLALGDLGGGLLERARAADAGRAARTLTAGGAPLRQVLLALAEGHALQEHTAPGPATLLVLRGRVSLTCQDHVEVLDAGTWTPIPTVEHALHAATDSVALLTVALPEAP